LTAVSLAQKGGIHGNLQIHTIKTFWGSDNNFDQLFGRANLMWAFQEDTTFSSLIHVRGYPAGFGYEKLIGAAYLPQDTACVHETGEDCIPVLAKGQSPAPDRPTIQIYQAWIRYKFTDFDLKVGRMITENTRSLHFGNYLDCEPGGTFTLARQGIHNALEGYKVYGVFDTRAHLGVGDLKGNRGYLRVYERMKPTENFALGLGYRVNVFDLVKYGINDTDANLTHKLALSLDCRIHTYLNLYMESAWSHRRFDDTKDPVPVLLSLGWTVPKQLKTWLKDEIKIPDVLDLLRIEGEYLYDRKSYANSYQGIDADFLWNVYGEKTWLKRMYFQGGVFAAPKAERTYNVGIGIRFTSKIN
jgi:hypothetical protein